MRVTPWGAALLTFMSVSAVLAENSKLPEVEALIQRQLDAFAHDDAAGAYAEAAPNIRAIFPNPDTFLAMVRQGYAPVYRHRSVAFGPATVDGETLRQQATFVDEQGKVWSAVYTLSRGPDGVWLISACHLVEDASA